MGDHADEATYDLLFGRGWDDDDDHHYADSLSYMQPEGERYPITCKVDFRDDEEKAQPEYQQLVVTHVHHQTEKAYCVSGVVTFDVPYRGLKTFEFVSDWVPKSQCIFTGNVVRLPQWLIRSRWRKRQGIHAQFSGLGKKADRISKKGGTGGYRYTRPF